MSIVNNILSRLKKKKITIICLMMVVCLFVIQKIEMDCREDDDITCHYVYDGDGLTPIGELNVSQKAIFFHETSCKGYLDSRKSCSIESAIRAHPDWQIYVLFSGPISSAALNEGSIKILKQYPNVHFARVRIVEYANNTPVEHLIGRLNSTKWKVEQTSHFLRYLTLYKTAGVYMDMDVVVARSISTLARNWAARRSDSEVAAGILAFSRDAVGRKMAADVLSEISKSNKMDWDNELGVMTRVLTHTCSTPLANCMSAAVCGGFEVYGPQFFYPVDWKNARSYFTTGDLNLQHAYTYHLWDHITGGYKMHKGSPYERLAKKYCPNIYNFFGAQFGQ